MVQFKKTFLKPGVPSQQHAAEMEKGGKRRRSEDGIFALRRDGGRTEAAAVRAPADELFPDDFGPSEPQGNKRRIYLSFDGRDLCREMGLQARYTEEKAGTWGQIQQS